MVRARARVVVSVRVRVGLGVRVGVSCPIVIERTNHPWEAYQQVIG